MGERNRALALEQLRDDYKRACDILAGLNYEAALVLPEHAAALERRGQIIEEWAGLVEAQINRAVDEALASAGGGKPGTVVHVAGDLIRVEMGDDNTDVAIGKEIQQEIDHGT